MVSSLMTNVDYAKPNVLHWFFNSHKSIHRLFILKINSSDRFIIVLLRPVLILTTFYIHIFSNMICKSSLVGTFCEHHLSLHYSNIIFSCFLCTLDLMNQKWIITSSHSQIVKIFPQFVFLYQCQG